MAYKGCSLYLEDWLLNSEHSLVEQSKSADMTKYEVNGDGFGVGWYGQKAEPGLFRSIRPAWNNTNIKSLAAHVKSPLFLAHVRYATGTPIQETNSHPFQFKNWLMVHNGLIREFAKLKKDLLQAIDNEYFSFILGSTDSEVLFYLLLSNGMQQDLPRAIRKTIQVIDKGGHRHGVTRPLAMTLGISDGENLWAVRYASDGKASTLFYSIQPPQQKLKAQEADNQLLVVSEPLDDGARCWSPITSNSLIQFDRNNAMTIQTIIEMPHLD